MDRVSGHRKVSAYTGQYSTEKRPTPIHRAEFEPAIAVFDQSSPSARSQDSKLQLPKYDYFLATFLPHLVFCSWSELAHGRCWSPLPSYQQVFPQVMLGGSGECCRCPRHCWSQPRDLARFMLTSIAFSYNLITITTHFQPLAAWLPFSISMVTYDFLITRKCCEIKKENSFSNLKHHSTKASV
jgi:hypothetical protein